MLVVASSVSAYARSARSRTAPMWNSKEPAFGWTWTTPTSVPSSFAYSLNAIRRGSLASMKSQSPGTRLLSSSSFPSLSLLVAMKMNGSDMVPPQRTRSTWRRPGYFLAALIRLHTHQLRKRRAGASAPADRAFLLQRVQPALSGLMDGSLSTLAPIFAVALATHQPRTAFFTGLATALGAGVSMAFSEGLSDTGEMTGRGNPFVRGGITGGGTFVGGAFHTLPFLVGNYRVAILAAIVVVAVELVVLAALRSVFFRTSFASSFVSVTLGGVIIASISSGLGVAAS